MFNYAKWYSENHEKSILERISEIKMQFAWEIKDSNLADISRTIPKATKSATSARELSAIVEDLDISRENPATKAEICKIVQRLKSTIVLWNNPAKVILIVLVDGIISILSQ